MQTQYPFILYASLPVLLIWWIFCREKVGYSFPNSLMKKYSRIPFSLMFIWILRCSMIFLTFLLLAVPSISTTHKVPLSSGKSVTLVLDISKSMLADDIAPSRLERAKNLLISFLSHESTNQYGLVIFAGKAFVLSPLTTDREGLSNMIQHISTDTIKQNLPGLSGTNIGDALLASDMLNQRKDLKTQDIILMTDGRANIGIDPITAAEYLRSHGARVSAIGIGESSGALLSYIGSDGRREYFYDEK